MGKTVSCKRNAKSLPRCHAVYDGFPRECIFFHMHNRFQRTFGYSRTCSLNTRLVESTGASCANCMASSSCGGDCALRNGKCVPQEEEYGLFPGGSCGAGYEPITDSWQDCKLAGEGLSYPAAKLTKIQSDYSAALNG